MAQQYGGEPATRQANRQARRPPGQTERQHRRWLGSGRSVIRIVQIGKVGRSCLTPDAAWLSTLGRALASGALLIVPLSLDCQPGVHMFHVKRVCSCRRPCQTGSTSMCGPVSASALSAGSRKYIKILRTCALTGVVRFPGWSGEAAEASTTRSAYRGTGALPGRASKQGAVRGWWEGPPGI